MARGWARRGVLGGLGGALAGAVGGARAQETQFFRIGTGDPSGTYFQIGELIASVISNPPGSRPCDQGGSCGVPGLLAAAQSSEGSVDNVLAISDGTVESGFAQADIAFWAYTGELMFGDRGRIDTLRAIGKLFTETVHVVTRADTGIATIAGLRGKRVSLNEEGSGTLVDARHILTAFGIGEDDVTASYLGVEQAIEALAAGQIDAFFHIAGYPTTTIAELAERVPIALIPITGPEVTGLLETHPFFGRDFLPTAVYRGVGTVETLSLGALWLCSSAAADDLIHGIATALWHEHTRALLDSGHPRGKDIRLERALTGVIVPLHPGAERYYREVGLIGAL